VIIELGLNLVTSSASNFVFVSTLRVFRLFRVARALRVFAIFPELNLILKGLWSAAKATLWGVMFLSIAILTWAIVATQIIHPLNQEITHAGKHEQCERCPHAWETVWQSTVTVVQAVLVVDGWGEICVPIIQYAPWTLVLFGAMICTTQLLLLNLILAVIVERATLTREEDLQQLALQEERDAALAQAKLQKSLSHLDRDASGTISHTELLDGYDTHDDIAAHVKALGIERKSLSTLFGLMDYAGTGEVPYENSCQVSIASKCMIPYR